MGMYCEMGINYRDNMGGDEQSLNKAMMGLTLRVRNSYKFVKISSTSGAIVNDRNQEISVKNTRELEERCEYLNQDKDPVVTKRV